MALSLPFPGQPAPNSALVSAPILANETAIAQAIQAFDGSQIVAGSVTASAFATSINPNTILHDTIYPFVQSGCVWSAVSGFIGTMTGGTIYVGTSTAFFRVIVNGIGSHTFAAFSDTYVDIDYNGNVYYSAVANNGTAPVLTTNALRVVKVITGISSITSTVQTGFDNIGNFIYNVTPNPRTIGYAQITSSASTSSATYVLATGLTSTVIIPSGRSIKITVFFSSTQNTNANTGQFFSVWDGTVGSGTQIQQLEIDQASATFQVGGTLTAYPIGASGSKTYNVGIKTTAGGANFIAATTSPAFISVELS